MTQTRKEALTELLARFDDVRMAYGAGQVSVSGASVLAEISDLIESQDAQLKAADALTDVTEACLRMMDDVIAGSGAGDMAIKPDQSLSVIDGWKRLAAYRRARGANQ